MGVGQLPEHCNVSERDDSEAPAAQTDDDANGDDDPGAVSPMRVSFSEPIGGMRTDVNDRNTADFQTHHPIDGRRPSYTETPEPHPGDPSPAHPSSDHHHNSHTSHAAHDADDTDDIPCYTPPRQRQRWGDTQIAPHTNWGDIFFDLFYVAAAYNLGNVLLADPTLKTGIFTTAGLFLPVLNLWYYKTFYDSRFYYRDDYYHRGYEIIVLLALATTVSHIRPGSIMLQPSKYEDMFLYSVGLSATFIFSMTRYIEVILCRYWLPSSHSGLHPETRYAARNDFVSNVPPLLCYLAAAIYSGTQYFSNTAANRNDDGNDDAYVGTNNSNSTPYYNSTDDQPQRTADDTAHLVRSLKAATEAASQEESSEEDHDYIPVWLLLGGIVTMLASYAVKMCILTTSREDHKA